MEDNIQGRQLPEDDPQQKTTFNGRLSSTEDDLQWKKTFDGKQPLTKDKRKMTCIGNRPVLEDDL